MTFDTSLAINGPWRSPVQLLGAQSHGDQLSVHDEATADTLGLAGAPIEGPTHFSQFDPLAHRVWGQDWFESGCISAHFSTMVVEGEEVQASLTHDGGPSATIAATKADGSTVLTGSASIAPHPETALEARLAARREAGELFVVDQLEVGMRSAAPRPTMLDMDSGNGSLYPFSLREKLDAITEFSSWYDSADNPWGRPVVPLEMLSVLANRVGADWPVRQPSLGLFLDLEVRVHGTPVFVDTEYSVDREIVGLSQSRRVESYWTRSTLTETATGTPTATVLLHSGVFKESYPNYPADRL